MTTTPKLVRQPPREPTIDPVVFAELRSLGEDLLTELVELFVHDTGPLLDQLRDAFETGDTPAVHRLAHSIKGIGAQLGGRRLAAACDRLEMEGIDGSVSAGSAGLRDVELDFAELRQALTLEMSPSA